MISPRPPEWAWTFSGVVAATITPMTSSQEVDPGGIHWLTAFLVERGVDALMVCGSTGEFPTLSAKDRSLATRTFVEAAAGRVPVIAHVGDLSPGRSARLAFEAAEAGADALASLTPYYLAHSQAAILGHLREVARTVPELPFFAYLYPRAAGQTLSADRLAGLADEPNLAGVKLSVSRSEDLLPFLERFPEHCVMSGNDALMGGFAAMGGRAVVSGNASAVPEVVVAAFRSLLAGEEAGLDLLERAAALSLGAPDRLKEILRRRGLDPGPARVRTYLPGELPEAELEAFLRELGSEVGRANAPSPPGPTS